MSARGLLRLAGLGLFALAWSAACACSHRSRMEPAAERATLREVEYAVGVIAPDARFANRHAQDVQIERAYLSIASLTLGRCVVAPPAVRSARAPNTLLRELFGVPRALAGHDGVLDPSVADTGWVVDLLRASPTRVLAKRYFPDTAYCRAQAVLAGAEENFAGYPSDVALRGYTLHVRGRYRSAGRTEAFVLETDLPYGALRELEPVIGARGRWSISYDLAAALQAIDLEHDEPVAASKQLLRRLVDGAEATFSSR